MNDYDGLRDELREGSFDFTFEDEGIMTQIDYSRLKEFATIIRKHLNAPYNYVDVKFPDKKLSHLIFLDKTWNIDNLKTDREAKEWALSVGLSKPETDWTTFF